MKTPTPIEWLLTLIEQPEQYADLLKVHGGKLWRASYTLAMARIQANNYAGPPSPADLYSAASAICGPTGEPMSTARDLAAECLFAGMNVSGF